MPLLLRIAGLPDADGEGRLVEVDTALRVGRAADNDLVLPDPDRMLSKLHCRIYRDDTGYVLVDESANGVVLNDSGERLPRDQAVRLRAGDDIHVGRFTLSVMSIIVAEPSKAADGSDAGLLGPVSHVPPPASARGTLPDVDGWLAGAGPVPGGSAEDFLADHEPVHRRAVAAPMAAQPDHARVDTDFLPGPRLRKESIPDDWDPLAELDHAAQRHDEVRPNVSHPSAPPPSAPPPSAPAPIVAPKSAPGPSEPRSAPGHDGISRIDDQAASVVPEANPFVEGPAAPPGMAPATTQGRAGSIDLLMAACGLGAVTLTEAQAAVAAERAGHLLRIAIDGMLQMLAGRSVAKQEFGLERTIISRGANNPLKFVTTADEALKLLLCGDLPGFLGAEDAMRETITDIKSHQLALLSGIQAAFAETLSRLDPASVERAVPRRPVDRVMPARRAARAWTLYQTLFAELQSSLADDRRDGFGSEFARAYASVQSAARSLKGDAADPSHEP